MPRPAYRPYADYTRNATALLGQLIREGRLARGLTTTDLAARAGISRALLYRIERGDPDGSIGAYFEVAAICGVPLFESDDRQLEAALTRQNERMTLLPKSVRSAVKDVRDDF